MRWYGAALSVLLVGCGIGDCPVTGGPAPAPTATDAPRPATTTRPRDPEPAKQAQTTAQDCTKQILDGDRIVHSAPARRTLYTWASDEQLDALRSSKQLLAAAGERPQAVTAVLAMLAVVAGKELTGAPFARTRSAWPLAWPTRLEAPGQRLLRIDLRPEALVVVFRRGELAVVDMGNHEVPLATVIEHPERIGAIYFVQEEVGPAQRYREMFVGNEALVEEWSSDTDAIRVELDRERALLARILAEKRSSLPATPSPTWSSSVVDTWTISSAFTRQWGCPDTEGYRNTLAHPTADYEPTARNLAHILDTLDATPPPTAEALVVRPTKETP